MLEKCTGEMRFLHHRYVCMQRGGELRRFLSLLLEPLEETVE